MGYLIIKNSLYKKTKRITIRYGNVSLRLIWCNNIELK